MSLNKPNHTDVIFAERIREKRVALGLTLREVSESIGKTLNAVSFYERGDRQPRLADLVTLSETLRCDPSWLLGVTDSEDPYGDIPSWFRPLIKKLARVKNRDDRAALKKFINMLADG
ncbi:MAG: helix-turn-helix transcriptional regulator [Deltaproteobacteria bacterium]|jgi:transcriptional regulator with XRE-family HTH domain|nr:helix-turn-helix transcriptional regulator [Deltaproteobacteria bacterium]